MSIRTGWGLEPREVRRGERGGGNGGDGRVVELLRSVRG